MAFLQIDDQFHELLDSVTIGSMPSCDISLQVAGVAPLHAIIKADGRGGWSLGGINAKSTTLVNDQPASEGQVLEVGDAITIGDVQARVCEASDATGSQDASEEDGVSYNVRVRLAEPTDNFKPYEQLAADADLASDYEKLRISYELASALGGEIRVDDVLRRIVATLMAHFNADHGAVFLPDDTGELRPHIGMSAQGGDAVVPVSKTILSEVVRTRVAVLSHDAMVDDRFNAAQSVMAHGIRSTMLAPMSFGEEFLGVISLDSQIRSGAFGEKEVGILQAAAHQAAAALHNSLLAGRLREEALVRQRFAKLVAPTLLEQIVDGSLEVEKAGELREISVLFCDIRGFTSYSESRSPEEIVADLNDYFEDMVEILFRYEGTLDKFVGDEIMGVFGAPVHQQDHAIRAVQAARDMQRHLLQRRDSERPLPFRVGIGVNSGAAVAGFLGSSRALDYTVIGDVVNTAARICSRAEADQVLVGASTAGHAPGLQFTELEPLLAKGKTQPVSIFDVAY